MLNSELIHQALVVGESCFSGRPGADGFEHGFYADQTIPNIRIGWHEVAALVRQRNQVGLVNWQSDDFGGLF